MQERRWFVVYTQASQESAVRELIAERQIPAFLPMEEKVIRHARSERIVQRPLFPMYLFAEFDIAADDWEPILEIRGVLNILGLRKSAGMPIGAARNRIPDRSTPLPLRKNIVPFLMSQMDPNSGALKLAEPEELPRLNAGDRIKVLDGPFTSFEGLVSKDKGLRVRVLLDFLGGENAITINRESVALSN